MRKEEYMKKEQILSLIMAALIIAGATTITSNAEGPSYGSQTSESTYLAEQNRFLHKYLTLKGISNKNVSA